MAYPPISHDKLLQIIKLAYEAAEDAALWPSFLEDCRSLVNARIGTLEVYDENTRTGSIKASVNVDTKFLVDYASYFAEKNPWHKGSRERLPFDKAVTGSMLVTEGELLRSEFYQDFMRHVGAFHLAGGMLLETNEGSISLSFFRPRACEDFGSQELALLNVLLPHVKQSLYLHQKIGQAEDLRGAMAEAIDRIPLGVIVVDGYSRILAANRKASEILVENDGLSSERDGLHASTHIQTASLQKLVACTAETSKGCGSHPGGVLSLRRPSLKDPLLVRVVPLSSHTHLVGHSQAAAVIFVSDPCARTALSHLASLFNLTTAEERLACKLLDGQTLDEIAIELQVSRNTVATQLKSIFQKTSTRRQADLIRLLLRSVATITP